MVEFKRSSRIEVTLFWNRSDLSMFLDSRKDWVGGKQGWPGVPKEAGKLIFKNPGGSEIGNLHEEK